MQSISFFFIYYLPFTIWRSVNCTFVNRTLEPLFTNHYSLLGDACLAPTIH